MRPSTDRATPQHSQARRAPARTGPRAYSGVTTHTIDPATGEQVETVGDEERCDPSFEADHTDERNAHFVEQRRTFSDQRRRQREAREQAAGLHARLGDVLGAIAPITTVGGKRLRGDERELSAGGPTTSDDPGSPGGRRPPGESTIAGLAHHDAREVERLKANIVRNIEALELILDEHRGLAPATDYALMGTDEKNAVILRDYVGVRPEDVHEIAPELGSASTIRKVRRDAERRGVCGHREDACDCQDVRKAPAKGLAA